MARSIGEAAALGLQSGFIMGRDTKQLAEENARRDTLLQQHAEQQAYERARQHTADQAAALAAQRKAVLAPIEGAYQSGRVPSLADRRKFNEDVAALDKAESDLRKRMGGVDLPSEIEAGKQAAARLVQVANPAEANPDDVKRAVVTATGQPMSFYMPGPDGSPPPAVQAADAMLNGIQAGDKAAILKGANALHAPALSAGVGGRSPHGGVIVGKEFVDLHPAPGSTPDDPRFIPTVRVYVRDEARAGDFARLDRANDGRPPGAKQGGATGYYDAPLTEDRSSEDHAKVKTIGLRDAQNFMARNVEVASLVSNPELLRKFAGHESSFDDEAFLAKFRAAGGKPLTDEQIKHRNAMELEALKEKGREAVADKRGTYYLGGKQLTLEGQRETNQVKKDIAAAQETGKTQRTNIAAGAGISRANIAAAATTTAATTRAEGAKAVAATKASTAKPPDANKAYDAIHKDVIRTVGELPFGSSSKTGDQHTQTIATVAAEAEAKGVPRGQAVRGAIEVYKKAHPEWAKPKTGQ